jgi:hypothetical protein
MLLAAASAATAGALDLLEAARDHEPSGDDLRALEVPEKLADALKMTLETSLDSYPAGEEREMAGQMLAACTRFLGNWA